MGDKESGLGAWADEMKNWLSRVPPFNSDAFSAPSLQTMRARFGEWIRTVQGPQIAMKETRDFDLPGPAGPMRARLYTPFEAGEGAGPCTLFFHGGGFVIGDLESHDRVCRRLAAASQAKVMALDYRLAPAAKFPAAIEDAAAALAWVRSEGADALGVDPSRLAVAGDSAGGNIAAVTAQADRSRAPETPGLKFQLLIYPWLQLADLKRRVTGDGAPWGFSERGLGFFRGHYLNEADEPADPRISPLLASDLAGVAPALVISAGLDPFQEEDRVYAEKLQAFGVRAEIKDYPKWPHGFMSLGAVLPGADAATDEAGRALGEALRF